MKEQTQDPKPEVKETSKKRTRSPSYPFISLEQAIKLAKTLYDHEKKNPARKEIIAKHWKYSASSSALLLAVAALKKFKLLDETKSGELKLTDLAFKILLLMPEDEKRVSAIKEAALSPTIHRELWEKYSTELPSDSNLRSFLLYDKEFNEGAVDGFIKEYKETIKFAGLTPNDTIFDSSQEDSDKTKDNGTQQVPFSAFNPINQVKPPAATGIFQATFPLSTGQAYICVPNNMTSSDKVVLLKYLDVWKDTIPESKEEPRSS